MDDNMGRASDQIGQAVLQCFKVLQRLRGRAATGKKLEGQFPAAVADVRGVVESTPEHSAIVAQYDVVSRRNTDGEGRPGGGRTDVPGS